MVETGSDIYYPYILYCMIPGDDDSIRFRTKNRPLVHGSSLVKIFEASRYLPSSTDKSMISSKVEENKATQGKEKCL